MMHSMRRKACLIASVAFLAAGLAAEPLNGGEPKSKGLWTDPNHPDPPAEFHLQSEYVGQIEGGGRLFGTH